MIGVTIGIGRAHRERAEAMIPCAKAALRLSDVLVLDETTLNEYDDGEFRGFERVVRLKFFVPRIVDQPYVYLDADLQFIAPVADVELDLVHNCHSFLAVRDRPYNSWRCSDRRQLGLRESLSYVNGGFYVVKRHHFPLFDWCLEHAEPGSWYPEQTTMNRGLRELGVETVHLNRTMNFMREVNVVEQRIVPCVRHGLERWPATEYSITPDVEAMCSLAGRHVVGDRIVELQEDGFTDCELAWLHDGQRYHVYDPDQKNGEVFEAVRR